MMKISPEAASSDEQHGPRRRRDLIAQADGVDAKVGLLRIVLAMLVDHRGVRCPQLGARRVEVRARREPANRSVIRCTRPSVIVADRWCGLVTMFAMISVCGGIRHRRLDHADDGRRIDR